MKTYEIKDHEASWLPDDGEFRLVWQDEFDGAKGAAFDDSKWDYRVSMMGKEHPAWVKDGVSLDGKGNIAFRLMLAEDGRPVSAQLQTGYNFMDEPTVPTKFGADALQWNIGKLHKSRFTHTYGYYECRCRMQQRGGWWSAFWMQSPIIGASLDPAESGSELDIMECFKPGEIITHAFHMNGYGADYHWFNSHRQTEAFKERVPHKVDTTTFHRYGLLWEEDGYTVYLDGRPCGEKVGCSQGDAVSKVKEFLLLTTECMYYRDDGCTAGPAPELEAAAAAGDAFEVDYVRVFDRVR